MPGRPSRVEAMRLSEKEYRAVQMRVEGRTEREIASELGMTQQGVNKMLRRVEGRLFAAARERLNAYKMTAHLRFERILAEAMDSWRRSKGRQQRNSVTRTLSGGTAQAGAEKTVQRLDTEESLGDTSYLGIALQAQAALNRLWGLDAPAKAPVPTAPNPYEQLSDAELLAAAEREIEEAKRRGSLTLPPVEEGGDG